jgi:hypothetical protein
MQTFPELYFVHRQQLPRPTFLFRQPTPVNWSRKETVMPELTKAESSRINGTKSRGPVTPEGKSRSSMNSLKHGMSSKAFCVAAESQDAVNRLAQSHLDLWQPVNDVEADLVEEMISAKWRQRRNWGIQTATIELEEGDVTMKLLKRYETQLNHQFHRAMDQLIKIRADENSVLRNGLMISLPRQRRTTNEQRRTLFKEI